MTDLAEPVVGEGDVLLRVQAAGVDQGVWHLMAGLPYLVRVMGFGMRAPKQRVRGMDVAGQVEAVGGNVSELRPGDEVFGTCKGAFAEYACARRERSCPSRRTSPLSRPQPYRFRVHRLQGLRDKARYSPARGC